MEIAFAIFIIVVCFWGFRDPYWQIDLRKRLTGVDERRIISDPAKFESVSRACYAAGIVMAIGLIVLCVYLDATKEERLKAAEAEAEKAFQSWRKMTRPLMPLPPNEREIE